MPEETRKRKKSGKRIVLLIIGVMLLLNIAFIVSFAVFHKDVTTGGKDIEISNREDNTKIPQTGEDAAVSGTVFHGQRYVKDLEQEVQTANEQDLYGFFAFAEEKNGIQYLSFSNGEYKVSYKNDTTESGSDAEGEVIISNGTQTMSFAWDYTMESGNVAALVPRVGDYCKNGRTQLVFHFQEHPTEEREVLHIVAGNTLMEYYCIAPDAALQNVITINGYLDGGRKVIADLTSDNRYYYVALPACTLIEAEERYELKANACLTYEVTENSITMQSFAQLGDGYFIGRIRGTMAFSSRDVFRLSSSNFYLFAEDDFSDVDGMGISEPVTKEELDAIRIPVVGDGGERILVRAKEEIEKHSYDISGFKKDKNGFLAYYEDGIKKSFTGVDVSKWQNDIDWKKVKAAGVDYAIIRLGFRGTAEAGNCALDSKFTENIEGALAAGLPVGVYYFSQAMTKEEAVEEARIVIDSLKGYSVTYPVIFDTEYAENARANSLSNQERTECAKAFCDTIRAAGYTPMVYSSTNWCVLDLDLEDLQEYDFWYAYYGEAKNLYFPYQFEMWQYTDSGTVDGIPAEVDLNISFVDYSARH